MASEVEVGLLSEGSSDAQSLGIICDRLLETHGLTARINDDLSKPANRPVSEKSIKLRTALFIQAGVDIAFYFADADKQGHNKKQRYIRAAIEDFDATWLDYSVIGVPDRNLEAWLLADQDNVKRFLQLDADQPLPHGEIKDPKERLLRLVSEYGSDSLTPSAFRKQMASQANLDTVAKSSDSFRAFRDDLSGKISGHTF